MSKKSILIYWWIFLVFAEIRCLTEAGLHPQGCQASQNIFIVAKTLVTIINDCYIWLSPDI